MTKRVILHVAVVVVVGVCFGSATRGSCQDGGPQMIPGETAVTSGRLEYRYHCGQCHGTNGKGDGPVASVLTKKPADLTLLAKDNGGSFPEDKVVSVINGTRR